MIQSKHVFDPEATINLGESLRYHRNRANMRIDEVCLELGMSKAHYGNLERGTAHNPSLDTLLRLGSLYNICVSELIGELSTCEDTQEPEAADQSWIELSGLHRLDALQDDISKIKKFLRITD